MSAAENKGESEKNNEEPKEEKKEPPAQGGLKTTTETATFFFLSNFNSKDASHEERLPKDFKDLEHLLNKILINLEETESVFLNQAKAVLERDLILINWRLRLKSLEKILKEKKQEFERIDQTVQCILILSSHIDNILVKLEKELPGHSLVENALKFSPARMSMYDAMIKTNINQRDMLQRIATTILSINEAIGSNPSDPVEQFTRVLSLHMEILKTTEAKAELCEKQLTTVEALHKYCINRGSQ